MQKEKEFANYIKNSNIYVRNHSKVNLEQIKDETSLIVKLKELQQNISLISLLKYKDEKGWKAIHFAAKSNSIKLMKYLLSLGFSPHDVTSSNQNVFSLAVDEGKYLENVLHEIFRIFIYIKWKKFGNKNANSYEEMEKIMKYEDQIISAYRSKLVYTFLQWKKAIQNRNEEEVEKIIKSIDFAWWFHQSQVRAINFAITYFDIHFFQFIIDNKIDNEYNHFLHDYDPNPVNHSPNRSTILHRLVKCFHLFINRNLNFRYYFPLFKQSIEYFLYDRNIPINAINKYDVLKIPLQAGFPIKNILYLWKIYEYLIGKGADIGYWNYQDTLIHHLVLGNESLQFGTSFDLHNIAKSLLIFSLDINPFFFSSHKNNNNNDNDDDDKGRKEDKEWNNYWKNNLYYEYQNYFKSKKKGVEEWKGIMIMVAKEEVPLLKLISKKERINKYATVRVELPIPSAYFRLYLHNGKEVYPCS